MIQECKRWSKTIMGKSFGQRLYFGAETSDCGIFLPACLMGDVAAVKSGDRFYMVICHHQVFISAHLIWDKKIGDISEAMHTLDLIAREIDLLPRATPLFLGIDANISVTNCFSFVSENGHNYDADLTVGKGVMESNKKHSSLNVLYFLNLCSYLGVRLTNTFAGEEKRTLILGKGTKQKLKTVYCPKLILLASAWDYHSTILSLQYTKQKTHNYPHGLLGNITI